MRIDLALEELVYFPLLLLVRIGILPDPVFSHREDVYLLTRHRGKAAEFIKMRDDFLRFYLLGRCGHSRRRYIENHLKTCEKCKRKVEEIKKDLQSAR